MKILGISAFYHDSSACLIENGEIIAACQEERLSRIKHDSAFPIKSILYCLEQNQSLATEIDHIIFYEKPFLKFERLLETYLAFAPKGFFSFKKAIPIWLNEKLFQKKLLQEKLAAIGFTKKQCAGILFSSHHLSHAASAFYPSPFDEALVLTMDGVGEWDTTSVYLGKQNQLTKLKELHFPHSLGLLYSAFTYYCGFKVNSGEYKLMGLAPYGEPRFAEKIKTTLISIKNDGSFKLDLSYFGFCTDLAMTNKKFDALFDFSFRSPTSELQQVHKDLAASIQLVLEEVILKICRSLSDEYKIENLCLAGGVALNCAANGKIYKNNLFKNIWVQPAAGDAGGSLGAALACHYMHLGKKRTPLATDSMRGAFLGPEFSEQQIQSFLINKKINYQKLNDPDLMNYISDKIIEQKVIGWFQGRMEFGPRALGNRSIIADARSAGMQKKLNLKIKFRESFRPFAPAVLEEETSNWFNYKSSSPYMSMVAEVTRGKLVPAVTHIDNSARIQTVSPSLNSKFYNLINAFKNKTHTPLLINTSFNIRGEPMVCSPEDAYQCFMGTDMDILVLGNFVLLKENQPEDQISDYKNRYGSD